ncbi:MAG: alpha/beta fold hydrolase [Chloroflexi bacterium]|nr:alpha/beta fold hydrolase [Chloroflexota bacterium]
MREKGTNETGGLFGDLLLLRKGGPQLTMGQGASAVARVETAEEWAQKAAALRDLFRQTLGVQPDVACPLEVRVESEVDRGDFMERRVSYAVEPDERVASLVLIPRYRAGPLPGVLCVHSTSSNARIMCSGKDDTPGGQEWAQALHIVRRGYVAFAPDLLGAGERVYAGRRAFDNTPFYEKHPLWSGTGKDVWDMRRALDVLTGLTEVDPARIGCIGHSQGGSVTPYTAAVDERVTVAVANCGVWPWRINKNPFHIARTGWWIGRPLLRPYAWAGKDIPCDVHELFACIAPRSLLNIAALNDFQYTLEEESFTRAVWEDLARNVEQVYTMLGAAGRFRQALHTKGHSFQEPERDLAYGYLDTYLSPGSPAARPA